MKKRSFKASAAIFMIMAFILSGCAYPMIPGGTVPSAGNVPGQAEEALLDESPANTGETEAALRIGSLKGPTSIGLVKLLHEAENTPYSFTMETQADVLLAGMVNGDLDIALIPANVASVLYQKTKGAVAVIDINTLGVLYMVSGDETIQSLADLEGKTVYTTGAGTTPEYVLTYLLSENGLLDKVNIEFKSEATEVAALLAGDPEAVGMLPQPFVTAALAQNEKLAVVLDMTEEWNALQNGSSLVTGVTVVRKDVLENSPEAVGQFLKDHAESTAFVNDNTAEAAQYTAEAGIIEKAPVAEKAIPYCNIVCITGEEMKTALSGYLKVLYGQDPAAVGGSLPEDDFYFTDEP
ncbi:MAG: ABC transporter substrate-binding protein [Lachnospiraceae bacterium]|nr:ABC transporter substrate-binding protein [Lachnospiraceae bacterium]